MRPVVVVINGIHSKSGGGITYLRKILDDLAAQPNLKLHLFLHASQLKLFYPICDNIHVTTFTFKDSFLGSCMWEQFSLPIITRAMGADAVYSTANYGPVFARNHVILLRNAVTVIRLIDRVKPALYWIMLAIATTVTFVTATHAIAVSNYAARVLTFGLPKRMKRKLVVVNHGVSHLKRRARNNYRPGTTLLAVSDIYVQKNYHTMMQAMSFIKVRHPELHLKIAGREIDQDYAQEVRDYAKKLGVDDRVTFLGHVSSGELISLYEECHIFVFPSFVETFGNPLLEAMSVGTPIACSNTAAMPEVIGDAGLLFDPHDAQDIADKIEKLHRSPDLRVSYGERAYVRAQQFSWARCAEETGLILVEAAKDLRDKPRVYR